jgi:hypothetical protein
MMKAFAPAAFCLRQVGAVPRDKNKRGEVARKANGG